jgi:hypothetical protein
MHADAAYVTRLAARLSAELTTASRAAPPPGRLETLRRGAIRAWRTVARQLRAIAREHWDVGVFDALFGSLKAFGVYPALYYAGMAWAIPLMEYAPLNTQLWTAGYLLARRRLLSALGRLRYGHSLERLDALEDRLLQRAPRDATVHRFSWQGRLRCVRVRRSRLRAWWERQRGVPPAHGVVLQRELRAMLSDPEFRFRADALRGNPHLYERVLIERLLATPGERERLLARAGEAPPASGAASTPFALLRETSEPTGARIEAERDLLAQSLRERGRGWGGPLSLALRWLLASHRGGIRRTLRDLRDLEYRLLADRADGGTAAAPSLASAIVARQGALRARLARATRLVSAVSGLHGAAGARRLLAAGLRQARAAGLPARRARLAAWCATLFPAGATPARPALEGLEA